MALTTGIIGLQGTIGGITFYMRKGKPCVRRAAGPSKEKIATSDNYQRLRENNAEFKGAIATSKFFRQSLNAFIKDYADWNISGRLNGVFNKMIGREEGCRGERSVDALKHKELLIGFNLDKEKVFDSLFQVQFTTTANVGRNEVRLTIPSFYTSKQLLFPSGATHFRLINAITVLSKFKYDSTEKKYTRADGIHRVFNASSYSDYVSINSNKMNGLTLTTSFQDSPEINPDSALVSFIGISFYQEVNSNMYALHNGNAMKINNVF